MDKLKGLLKQLGGSDELVEAINEEISNYANQVKSDYDDQFKDKIQKARQICLEEVQKEKASLARKVSTFLESKLESIDKAAEKQRLQEETEATNRLKRAKALLEDVQLDDNGQSRELQTTKNQLSRLTKAINTLKEERDMAVRKANTANEIALKALQRNKLLESKTKAEQVVNESKAPILETKTDKQPEFKVVLQEGKQKLGSDRQIPSNGKTTRPTLVESQVRTPQGGTKANTPSADRITGIAATMSEDD